MNYLSVCSGIEAATVAWHHMGWKPLAFSEIEKFPLQVLAHHYPAVPNLGDMTKYKEWDFGANRLDLLVGGTPCQSFSVAGLRKGLDDPRGNLALTYVGILDKFRPKWCVWENVPGVLSSGNGRDFGAFLGALGEIGYGFAYRVLDAQYFGLAQRRKRVFVIGCLGSWESAAKVLFDTHSLSGNTKSSKKKKQETTRSFIPSIANCIQTTCNDYSRADGFNMIPEVVGTMTTRIERGTSEWFSGYIQPGYSLQGNLIGRDAGGPNGIGVSDSNTMYTLTKSDVHAIAFPATMSGTQCASTENLSPALKSTSQTAIAQTNMVVRRLTPIECERLQGFPDNYTNIPKAPDGNRYKALGNSMAVPVMRWIGERINNL